jgi:hypothetical protein
MQFCGNHLTREYEVKDSDSEISSTPQASEDVECV